MRKSLVITLSLFFVLLLGGCQLAAPDGAASQAEDRLIGVLLTTKYLDLFDIEGYLNNHLSSMDGNSIEIKPDARYEGRIYAQLAEIPLTNEETGKKTSTWEYRFDDVGGIALFSALVTPPDGDPFYAAHADEGMSDVHTVIGGNNSAEGTVYIMPGSPNTYYINPVRQDGDGRVYVTTGSGYSFSENRADGSVFTSTLDETYTATENGVQTEESFSITIHLSVMYRPVRMHIVWMDADHRPLRTDSIPSTALPDTLTAPAGSAYLIAETYSTSPDGDVLRRALYDPDTAALTAYTAREDGICAGKYIEIVW